MFLFAEAFILTTMTDAYPNQSLIKRDIEEIVGRVVGEIVGAALQLIANQFDEMRRVIEPKADKSDITRLENKIDATVDLVDDHNRQLRQMRARHS